jgi:hypothetical protein
VNARPGGPTAKRQPSPEGLGNSTEEDPSAVGAALNRAISLEAIWLACGKLREE